MAKRPSPRRIRGRGLGGLRELYRHLEPPSEDVASTLVEVSQLGREQDGLVERGPERGIVLREGDALEHPREVLRLRRDGHEVCAWVRDEARAKGQLGAEVDLVSTGASRESLVETLAHCDAVVNLAGESIAAGRWTHRRKEALVASRVGVTERVVDALLAAERPRVLVSASATGFYGDRGDERLDEESGGGAGFLADLCRDWEAATTRAVEGGVRVVSLRMGVVLGREGGALAKLLRPFRAGLGGVLGSGRQFVSWIHLHDLVEVVAAALSDERFRGPLNAVAPQPVTNRELTGALGRALDRPTRLPVPRASLRLVLGEGASALFESQRVFPKRLLEVGFRFRFPMVDDALWDLLDETHVEIGPIGEGAGAPGARRARHLLRTSATLAAPVGDVFAFFSAPANLGVLTPPRMRFRIARQPAGMSEGTVIEYRIRIARLDLGWRTRIERWEPGRGFVDSQIAGPYRLWRHEHTFQAVPDGTKMEDVVSYAVPLGWLGLLANRLFVAPELRRIFSYRRDVIRFRFGIADEG